MPIDVVSLPNTVFGPGVGVIAHTSLTGPFPSDWTWHLEIGLHGVEGNPAVIIDAPLWAADQHERRIWIGEDPDGGQTTFYARYVALQTGQSIDLNFQLLGSDGVTVEDSGTVTGTWDTDSSGRENLPATTGAGLTTEQATQLSETHAQLTPTFISTTGAALPATAGELIVRPTLDFLGIDTTTHVLTGQGTLSIPRFLGAIGAWGAVLDVLDPGPGRTRKTGFVDRFAVRMGQFLLLWPARNTAEAMVIAELNLHLEHFTWIFPEPLATDLAYSIDELATVQLRFAQAFFP